MSLSLSGNFVISRATPYMFTSLGYGAYLYVYPCIIIISNVLNTYNNDIDDRLFGSMMILSIVYIILLLPETKNIPLEEMDRFVHSLIVSPFLVCLLTIPYW